ncbi:hypothetical protein Bbelb_385820 [Branchiostoma belcheri]|nr:hypothetical protein Bbelb_385820 [Branchiostoma belcheri]
MWAENGSLETDFFSRKADRMKWIETSPLEPPLPPTTAARLLVNLPSSTLAKRVFLLRLYSYIIRRARHANRGFISDVYRVAQEYGLTEYFEKYWLTTEFPSNTVWKRVVKMAVWDKEERNWIASDNGKTRFTRIHGTNTDPHKLWSLARKLPNHQKTLQALVHLSTAPACHSAKPCPACDTLTQDIVGHMISHCVKFNTLRATLADVLTDKLGTGVMAAVHQQSDERFTEVLLGARVVEEDVEPGNGTEDGVDSVFTRDAETEGDRRQK